MKPLTISIALFGLLLAVPPASAKKARGSRVMQAFAKALLAGDLKTLKQLHITYDELRKISHKFARKSLSRAKFDQQVEQPIGKIVRELTQMRQQHKRLSFDRVELKEAMLIHAKGGKPSFTVVVFRVVYKQKDGKEKPMPFPLFLIQVGDSWRVSIHK